MARVNRQGSIIRVVWIAGVVLGVVGLLLHQHIIHIAQLARHDFLLLAVACVLLAIAGVARGF